MDLFVFFFVCFFLVLFFGLFVFFVICWFPVNEAFCVITSTVRAHSQEASSATWRLEGSATWGAGCSATLGAECSATRGAECSATGWAE